MKQALKGIYIFFILVLSKHSFSDTSDFQVWTNLTATGPLYSQPSPFKYWLETQPRMGEDATRLSQLLVRPGLGYELTRNSSAWVGYAWIYTTQPFSPFPFTENRIWQQFLWFKEFKGYTPLKLVLRTRLEQRFFQHVGEVAWRARQFVKTEIPFSADSKWQIVLSEEFFLNLNNFNNIENQGPDQNRFFIGLRYPLKPYLNAEIGYLNQMSNQVDQPNFKGHDLSINFLWTF